MDLESIKLRAKCLTGDILENLSYIFNIIKSNYPQYNELKYVEDDQYILSLFSKNYIINQFVILRICHLKNLCEVQKKKQMKKFNREYILPKQTFCIGEYQIQEFTLDEYKFQKGMIQESSILILQYQINSDTLEIIQYFSMKIEMKKYEESVKIISQLNTLSNLKRLHLVIESLESYSQISSFAEQFPQLLNLEELFFSLEVYDLEFEQKDLQALAKLFQNFQNLQKLELRILGNPVSYTGINDFFRELPTLEKLTHLQIQIDLLQEGQEGEDKRLRFLEKISSFHNLQVLFFNVFSCQITPLETLPFRTSFLTLSQLKILDINLYGNAILNQGIINITQGIQNCLNLQQLNLTCCYGDIGNDGIISLGNSLSQCRFLKKILLQLQQNLIQNEGLIYLGEQISTLDLTDLEIYVSINQITSQGMVQFTNDILKCSNLIKLNMSQVGNMLDIQGVKQTIDLIYQHNSLLFINLNFDDSLNEDTFELDKYQHKLLKKPKLLEVQLSYSTV